ncbi:MAG TPA: hypothetical protein DCW29_07100 [Janthinobacterium sp.]|nr:hypothetical protein [Janthinobacterium sp.]
MGFGAAAVAATSPAAAVLSRARARHHAGVVRARDGLSVNFGMAMLFNFMHGGAIPWKFDMNQCLQLPVLATLGAPIIRLLIGVEE